MKTKLNETLSAEEVAKRLALFDDVVDRLAMLSLNEDMAKAEVWRNMAEQADTWGYPEVAADLRAHAVILESLNANLPALEQ